MLPRVYVLTNPARDRRAMACNATSAPSPVRNLHFVFKVADRARTVSFYRDVLLMQPLRHEEFTEGCSAACNGPYDGRWSKTMIGYGEEDSNFVLELTYNYGVKSYDLGNDFDGIVVRSTPVYDNVVAKGLGTPLSAAGAGSSPATALELAAPGGYRFLVLRSNGEEPGGAAAAAEGVLFYAQLRDNNQGIIKITSGGLRRSPTARPPVVEKETRLSALINGNNSPGMLVLKKAALMAVERAKAQGFGIVGTNHTASSTGALGYYVDLISRQGLIGIVLAQSPEFVAPHGAKQPIFGTNPIGISIPAEDGAVTMDMATAAFAWFGLLEAKAAGRPIPGDVAMDSEGLATTDPNDVLSGGAIRVFDRSYKGSG
ncbi:Glyoxalase domain-containing protein 4 [Tetrabaena socialis]|uniref:Glyoxalase domain-containing protein 4 n=1 Tax=Tetrabaena socialis TaxID=47790 RepID=A0A2J7ZWY3_9CHLO|nr:Glyoxalase domain-containing protein 4 [Tetrabaena socialis]|eukprot:PNH04783.1 Glyoxalase domain-containing protein 4 [Tetrabaena socialis]